MNEYTINGIVIGFFLHLLIHWGVNLYRHYRLRKAIQELVTIIQMAEKDKK